MLIESAIVCEVLKRAVAEAKERKAKGLEKKRAEEAATAAAVAYNSALRKARQYAKRVRAAYPNVEVLTNKKAGVVRVIWTTESGAKHRQDFR